MKTEPSVPCDPFAAAERALSDAGISYATVDRCPASSCPVCGTAAKLAPAA